MAAPRTFEATVDRIEGDVAVLLPEGAGARPFDLPLALLPPVREGLVLRVTIEPDDGATTDRAAAVKALAGALAGEDGGEDFEL
jgi:hypothetical protein